MLFREVSLATILATTSSLSFAQEPVIRLGSGLPLSETAVELESSTSMSPANTYQIGDEWGKKPLSNADLAAQPQLLRAAQATASLGGATGFYLGTYNGQAVVATNHHVCPSLQACVGKTATFPLLGKSARVRKSLGTWTEIDLSLVIVDISPRDASAFARVASNFDFATPVKPGQPLFTAGFGVASNPLRRLMANQDGDCKVFSQEDDFRLMADPDDLNPGTYEAWSFANGCDVSHGDSGSAMVDRKTGKPVGLIWTGKIPKSDAVKSSERLAALVGTDDPDVWKELSYAVPAVKIKEYLTRVVDEGSLDEDVSTTIQAIVGASSVL